MIICDDFKFICLRVCDKRVEFGALGNPASVRSYTATVGASSEPSGRVGGKANAGEWSAGVEFTPQAGGVSQEIFFWL